MENLEKQVVELQNKVIKYEKDKVDANCKVDEMSERADFYENLHNQEQRDLYNLEVEYADYRLKMETSKREMEEAIHVLEKKNAELECKISEWEEHQLHIMDEFDGRTLMKMSLKKLKQKIVGR